jgi:hypothetical protein
MRPPGGPEGRPDNPQNNEDSWLKVKLAKPPKLP